MTSSLEWLVATGVVSRAPPDREEIAALLRAGRARLADAERADLSPGSRFDLAFNAAHALALAALEQRGYRSAHRLAAFQSLPYTLGLGREVWRVLVRCHETREREEHEGPLEVDERLLDDLLRATRRLRERQGDPRLSSRPTGGACPERSEGTCCSPSRSSESSPPGRLMPKEP